MAARKYKGTKNDPWPQQTRDKIQTSMLVNRLQMHIHGEVDMKPTQVQAALGLLRKTIPDISESKALNINIDGSLSTLSDADLMDAIEHVRQQIAATRQSSLANMLPCEPAERKLIQGEAVEHVSDTELCDVIDSKGKSLP